MDFQILILLIRNLSTLFIWVVIAYSLLSFFVPPYHPVREALERIVSPFLDPIRRILPAAGPMDFSPVVLILAIDVLSRILIAFLISLS
ncbi:MAG TPA: YggT family protein [Anaerolineales bacterium]|nr:YggT family protein [Anaerolineales bacterium]HNA53061.1 YggT family protein [Anaerolineales bacterium]HNB86126.1 YggT family protein [Anaerolineales bacterium]HND91245.1 YggT family protein [Anaerolineales bacterium]HNE67171.1 YggT family protein [Anaerolineales bacterium]